VTVKGEDIMKFYIADTFTNGSGQEFTSKEAFLRELSMMIDDCEVSGGTTFDVTVDSDASCFNPDSDNADSDLEKVYKEIDEKREACTYGYWKVGNGKGFWCEQRNCFVTGHECLVCGTVEE
jgi:hypothetical protein